MGQLGGEGNALVVVSGVGDGHPAKAHRGQQLLGLIQQTDVEKVGGAQDHGSPVKEVLPAVLEAGVVGTCHGVTPQEPEAVLLSQGKDGIADLLLGAGAVDDHGVLAELGGQLLHMFDDRLGVGGQKKEVHFLQILVGQFPVDGLGQLGELEDGAVGIPTQDGHVLAAAEGLRQRAADEA